MVRLDVEHVFLVAGGPQALVVLLDRHCSGHTVTYPAVQMWHSRHTLPGPWIVPVLYALSREGHPWEQFCTDDAELGGGAAHDTAPQHQPAAASIARTRKTAKPARKRRARGRG